MEANYEQDNHMSDVVMPKIIEFMKTETLAKGRVRTTLILFLLDIPTFHDICSRFLRGETSFMEVRLGTVIKHPKDKYSKTIAKEEAAKRLKKEKWEIRHMVARKGNKVEMIIGNKDLDMEIVCDGKGLRFYVIE